MQTVPLWVLFIQKDMVRAAPPMGIALLVNVTLSEVENESAPPRIPLWSAGGGVPASCPSAGVPRVTVQLGVAPPHPRRAAQLCVGMSAVISLEVSAPA